MAFPQASNRIFLISNCEFTTLMDLSIMAFFFFWTFTSFLIRMEWWLLSSFCIRPEFLVEYFWLLIQFFWIEFFLLIHRSTTYFSDRLAKGLSIYLFTYLFGSIRAWTQGLVLARQVCYHLTHPPDLTALVCATMPSFFYWLRWGEGLKNFLLGLALNQDPPNLCL
jgi:hypothetical protein